MMLALCALLFAEPAATDYADPKERLAVQVQILEQLIDSGMSEEALVAITALREEGLSNVELDLLQARALHATKKLDEAAWMTERVLRWHKQRADAWALLGLIYADQQKLDASVAALRKAARKDAGDPVIFNNLGFAELASGQYEAAADDFQQALRLDPTFTRARNNLAMTLVQLERDTEALELFRASSTEADARYNFGVACEMREDRACAILNYQAALAAEPEHRAAQAALDLLLTGTP